MAPWNDVPLGILSPRNLGNLESSHLESCLLGIVSLGIMSQHRKIKVSDCAKNSGYQEEDEDHVCLQNEDRLDIAKERGKVDYKQRQTRGFD